MSASRTGKDGLPQRGRLVFPDDASAAAGAVYLQDPAKLERMLTA